MPPPSSARTMSVGGLVLDARRAVFLPSSRTLVVADLHLGYAWAKRARGALLPVSAPEDTAGRLVELQRDHGAKRIVVLGDIIHEAVALPVLEQSLRDLAERLAPAGELAFCLGNHDHKLDRLVTGWKLPITCHRELELDAWRLLHGDTEPSAAPGETSFRLDSPARCLVGHEHPCVALDDGVSSRVRCPAFLFADDLLVLPAFSTWAAGCEIGRQPFMGPLARKAKFHTAYACMGPRLLRLPLRS